MVKKPLNKILEKFDESKANKILEKFDESKANKAKPLESNSSKKKEAVKTLGKAAARAGSVMASFIGGGAGAVAAKGARAARKALKK